MPPVIGVDREAFADGAMERGEDRKVGALPVYADEDVAKIPRHFRHRVTIDLNGQVFFLLIADVRRRA
jgi:hypothetical protein